MGQAFQVGERTHAVEPLTVYKVGAILDLAGRVTAQVGELREQIDAFHERWRERRRQNPELPESPPWEDVALDVVPRVIGPARNEVYALFALALAPNGELAEADDPLVEGYANADAYIDSFRVQLVHALRPSQAVEAITELVGQAQSEFADNEAVFQRLLDQLNALFEIRRRPATTPAGEQEPTLPTESSAPAPEPTTSSDDSAPSPSSSTDSPPATAGPEPESGTESPSARLEPTPTP